MRIRQQYLKFAMTSEGKSIIFFYGIIGGEMGIIGNHWNFLGKILGKFFGKILGKFSGKNL
ncbi:hypothetical protein [Mastigocoleus testarum]|nr:hypothetical protein [Mastigocoleus testarum]